MPKIVLLAIYPLAGIVAGSLVGLFRTRLQSRRFSQILGGSLGSPLGLVILWLEKGSLTDLEPAGLVGVTVGMFVLGWFGGGIFWNRLHDVS